MISIYIITIFILFFFSFLSTQDMTTSNHSSLGWKINSSCMGDFPLRYNYYYSPQHQHESHNYYIHNGLKLQKEHLFEKQLTPSDVGKLNRLVIPKQHAERHFPLDGESGEKGLLLRFDDDDDDYELGKTWWFRYSYWSSSQSYVLTKGWSRFVKEKKLYAGDTVVFEKKFAEADHESKLCIGWRRRVDATNSVPINPNVKSWSSNLVLLHGAPQTHLYNFSSSSSISAQRDCSAHEGGRKNGSMENSMGSSYSTSAPTNSKKLRLFGVNLECGLEDSNPVAADCDIDPRELQLLPCIGFSDS